ncbi:MAG TPA: rRNA adenine dimethyltransferase family protein [Patescibacteria group bacterium]|nr:rRNA adenine dimethyltransferase family protein [Patescibacteria group bacterium]
MIRKHEYDQHFLRSPRLVAELIGHSNIRKNDTVYDFGAGSGVISSVLAHRARRVVAVENEPATFQALTKNMAAHENVHCIRADALTVSLPNDSYKVFANPPFSIISDLVRRLMEAPQPPKSIYLIAQKQFARKIVPSDAHFTSALGIEIAPLYAARIRKPLRKTDFTPPPAVDTVLLELRLRDAPLIESRDLPRYRSFVRECFASSRTFNALDRSAVGISPERKPSELTVAQWISLFTAHSTRRAQK